jgi:tetratricopeptide (TPR) repeat protein
MRAAKWVRRLPGSASFGYTPQSTNNLKRICVTGPWRFVVVFRTSATKAAILLMVGLGLAAQEKKKEWKDRPEYDLYEAITKASDPNVWLTNLDKWKTQYPQSEYADVRRQMYLATYRQLNRTRDAWNAALEVLKDNPNNLVALSTIVGSVYQLVGVNEPQLTAQMSSDLDAAEKSAMYILGNLDAVYSKDNRPPEMTDEAALKAKPEMRTFAQKTIGYVAMELKDNEKAQSAFTKTLQLDPNQGQVSFWLAGAVLAQNKTKPELQPLALFEYARAASYDGAGSLPASDRKQVQDYLNRIYVQYHGSHDGLDKLLATAKLSPLPPAGFTVLSKVDLEKKRIEAEEAAARANPMLALWKSIRMELMGENGPNYFEARMHDAVLPGGVNGVEKLKGTLVSASPPVRPKELVLAIENPSMPDVTLKLDSALPGSMEPGSEIEFEGVAKGYTKEPFMVMFEVDKAKLAGWTGKNEERKKSSAARKKS